MYKKRVVENGGIETARKVVFTCSLGLLFLYDPMRALTRMVASLLYQRKEKGEKSFRTPFYHMIPFR